MDYKLPTSSAIQSFLMHRIIMIYCLLTTSLHASTTTNVNWNIEHLVQNSDIILVGKILPARIPHDELFGDHYMVLPEQTLKGELPVNSLLETPANYLPSNFSQFSEDELHTQEVEWGYISCDRYVLFLKEQARLTGVRRLHKGINIYNLASGSNGIVALDMTALERRSITIIGNQFDFVTYELSDDFITAIRAYLVILAPQKWINEGYKLKMSPGSKAIYDKIKKERIVHYKQDGRIIRTIDKNKELEDKLLEIAEPEH